MLQWSDKIDGVDDVLAQDINSIANEVISTQNTVSDIVEGVENNTGNIASLQTNVDTLQVWKNNLITVTQNHTARIDTLEPKVSSLESDMNMAKIDISDLFYYKDQLGFADENINERLTKLEQPSYGELIEEITVTDNTTTSIVRTQEPNGTPYNFKAVTIYQEIKDCKVANLIITNAYSAASNLGTPLIRFQGSNTVTTSGRFLTVHMDVIGGCWKAIGTATTIQGSPTGVVMWRDTPVYSGETLKCVEVYGYTTNLEVGTTVQIYGVRA